MKATRQVFSVIEIYSLYLLTGAACIVIGSSVPQLMEHFQTDLAHIAALASAFAFGRMATVFITGWLTERLGPKRILCMGLILNLLFFGCLPFTKNYIIAVALSAAGGIGMGAQDAAGPVLLNYLFPKSYASAMSAGQAFFGAGCFLPPLIMSLVLSVRLPFYYTYFSFTLLAALMLALLPFAQMPAGAAITQENVNNTPSFTLRHKWAGLFVFGVIIVAYCAVVNTMNMYTVSFANDIGMMPAVAVVTLTAFNLGSTSGSFVFVGVLKKVSPVTVLWVNLMLALAFVCMVLLWRRPAVIFVCLFLAGFFLGVLFSVLVTVATGLNPAHTSIAATIVATLCSASDAVTPLLTGAVATKFGVLWAYIYAALALSVALAGALIFRGLCKTKKQVS